MNSLTDRLSSFLHFVFITTQIFFFFFYHSNGATNVLSNAYQLNVVERNLTNVLSTLHYSFFSVMHCAGLMFGPLLVQTNASLS